MSGQLSHRLVVKIVTSEVILRRNLQSLDAHMYVSICICTYMDMYMYVSHLRDGVVVHAKLRGARSNIDRRLCNAMGTAGGSQVGRRVDGWCNRCVTKQLR
jgi:hypothetical protein